jgi:hypothetical protein
MDKSQVAISQTTLVVQGSQKRLLSRGPSIATSLSKLCLTVIRGLGYRIVPRLSIFEATQLPI